MPEQQEQVPPSVSLMPTQSPADSQPQKPPGDVQPMESPVAQAAQEAPPVRVSLPLYRSHKIVGAARIVATQGTDDGMDLILDTGDGRDQCVQPVSEEWVQRHKPRAGGYFVRYSDSYESWSPAEAFEAGYRRLVGASLRPLPVLPVRELLGHRVNECNSKLRVVVMDEPGDGGASHLYSIDGFNTATNASDVFQERHGAPAEYTSLLFQRGPIGEVGTNGITHEALLAILVDRLEGFQAGPFACAENAAALRLLVAAQGALATRTRRRVAEGTEGTHSGQ